jgi:hypothetical protein
MPSFWRRAKPERTDPKESHAFVETNDPGLGAVVAGSAFQSTNTANVLGATTAFLRSTRCALPGCGKERHDPIHAQDDE